MRQLRNPVRIAECPEHAEAAAASDIGRYRERHPGIVGGRYVEEAAPEMEVGRRAESCGRAGLRHSSTIRLVEMDAVGINCTLAEQAVAVVHVEVAAGLWKQLLPPGNLFEVLRHMGLDESIWKRLCQLPGAFQLCVGRCHCEARRNR